MVMEEMPQRRVTHLLKRGAYDAPGEVVQRDTPGEAACHFRTINRATASASRTGSMDRKNPLTARVAVNRIWRMHFGRGLVASQEDFGAQGRLPSHPELLDWLAGWFMDNGWDVKALHKLIVSSATFQQSSQTKRGNRCPRSRQSPAHPRPEDATACRANPRQRARGQRPAESARSAGPA